MNKGMRACFDTGYVLADTSDDERTASTVQHDTSPEYQQALVSKQELCEGARQRVPAPVSTTDVWRGITYC